MVETIEIKEFLKAGNFGQFKEIHFGMSRNKLIEILGDTDWKGFSYKKAKFPSILKYGKVEFYFEEGEEGRLNGIQILPTIQEANLLNLNINYDFIKPNLDFDSALKFLDSESIKYRFLKNDFDSEDVRRIETEGEVQIIFSEGYEEIITIHKVSKFIELISNQVKIKTKQINFSIPETDYLKLKEMAISSRKSIQNICKEIISNKLNKK